MSATQEGVEETMTAYLAVMPEEQRTRVNSEPEGVDPLIAAERQFIIDGGLDFTMSCPCAFSWI